MQLDASQLTTLKTWLDANTSGQNDQEAADTLNATASPDFWVWRTSITKDDLVNKPSMDATTFAWSGTGGFIARSRGEQNAWRELFSIDGTVNASLPNVRQAFQNIFSGSLTNAPENRTHLVTVARRLATLGEQELATGTGSTGSPATMGDGAEGTVTIGNVVDAREL